MTIRYSFIFRYWACHNTQAASLASFRIHYYGSMNFCHKRNSLKVINSKFV